MVPKSSAWASISIEDVVSGEIGLHSGLNLEGIDAKAKPIAALDLMLPP